MAQTDRFYIGLTGNDTGIDSSLKPFLIPDAAFQTLNNAYVFRGRVRKRFGSRLMEGTTPPVYGYEQLQSRLRINLGVLTSGQSYNIDTILGTSGITALGQMFSSGNQMFTINTLGAAAVLLTTGSGASLITGVIDTSTGDFTFTGTMPLAFFFYPSLPVMGLVTYQTQVNHDETIFAFDTLFAYQFTTTGWSRLGTALWSGSNCDFFWGTNWNGILRSDNYLFTTNFVEADQIKYFDGTSTWKTIAPIINNTSRLHTARIILPFKDRLIMLNTIEFTEAPVTTPAGPFGPTDSVTGDLTVTTIVYGPGFAIGQSFVVGTTIFTITDVTTNADVPMDVATVNATGAKASATFNGTTGKLVITGMNTNRNVLVYFSPNGAVGTSFNYQNRCRYSINGSPVNTNSFLEVSGGGGGYVDCPVKEAIITAQFLRDRLIVYFEQSTWELVYTGNQILPFLWQQINTEFGAESTFSQVPFDKVVLGVGNVGIVACSGNSVERIDNKIPDEVFEIHNSDGGLARVYGIRDYYVEMVYWSFADPTRSSTTPWNNKVLVYNYKTQSWALNDDSITAFGYYQSQANEGETWQSDHTTWESDHTTWQDGPNVQAQFRSVIAGNQEGFVFIVDPDEDRNSPALTITDIETLDGQNLTITCYNHNLQSGFDGIGDYIAIENVLVNTTPMGSPTIITSAISNQIYAVGDIIDANTFTIVAQLDGVYVGAGTIARVSNIDIVTKQYNFYMQDGYNASINKVDFLVDKTDAGEITVDYLVSSSGVSTLQGGALTGALLGNGTLQTSPYVTYSNIGTTDTSGNATGITFASIGDMFKIGNQIFTIISSTGALETIGSGSGTYNTVTGAYTFTGASPSATIFIGQYLIPLETSQDRLWHPVYPMVNGECIQLNIYMTDQQLKIPDISFSGFELHAMTFYAQKTSSRLQ